MSLGEVLLQSGAISSMASELGIDDETARSAASVLLPAITAGIGRSGVETHGIGGMGSLVQSVGGPGASVLLDLVLGPQKTPIERGNDILGQIFGSKDVSRSVATEASNASGISPDILKKMLPLLAMAAMGYLAKRGKAKAAPAPEPPASPSLGGILGSLVDTFSRG